MNKQESIFKSRNDLDSRVYERNELGLNSLAQVSRRKHATYVLHVEHFNILVHYSEEIPRNEVCIICGSYTITCLP